MIYFDICSIPLFLMILFVCRSRKMTKGSANRLFILLVVLSLFSAVADLAMESMNNCVPLPENARTVCSVMTHVYLIFRNANNVVLLLFLLALTRTGFLLDRLWAKIAFIFPYACVLVILSQNPFTHNVFSVTAEKGYVRGPLMNVLYGIALVYGLVGLAYCIYCRRYLPLKKWAPLLTIYIVEHLAVLIQFFRPGLLLEMFCTAAGELLVMLSIMRPEERMDGDVGMLSWASYESDLKNIVLSGEHVGIVVMRMPNCRGIRNYLGDHRFNGFVSRIGDALRSIRWKHPERIEIYFERPERIYLITDADEPGAENVTERLKEESPGQLERYAREGVLFEPQICFIRCPEDLKNFKDVVSLGHRFHEMDRTKKSVVFACDIVSSKDFAIGAHIDEILERAIKDGLIEIYYQPIYDVRSSSFRSAEALARLNDPEFGMIPPGIFIPAAETLGFIIRVGDAVLEKAFSFISSHDLDALGLDYVEINLSVAQCMESTLPEKIASLQDKYRVDPKKINFEITETTFEDISETALENVNRLTAMGFTFALDDYGIGYSSIQRINRIPLKLVKLDKSMIDEIPSKNGRMILEHTVRMMQSIGKELVAEGAETREDVGVLETMHCDNIQGFYFSRPLPAEDFVSFLKEHDRRGNDAT